MTQLPCEQDFDLYFHHTQSWLNRLHHWLAQNFNFHMVQFWTCCHWSTVLSKFYPSTEFYDTERTLLNECLLPTWLILLWLCKHQRYFELSEFYKWRWPTKACCNPTWTGSSIKLLVLPVSQMGFGGHTI